MCAQAPALATDSGGMMTEDEILAGIFRVPEVAAWADAVRANGNRVVVETEQTADPACPDLACLTCLRLIEDLPTHRATYGTFCANPVTGDLLRWDDAAGAPTQLPRLGMPQDLEPNRVAPPDSLRARMPPELTGWLQWDGSASRIAMRIAWRASGVTPDGMAEFRGEAVYTEPNGRVTRAPVRLWIDDVGGAVVMWEEGGGDQPDFDATGQFTGAINPESLVIDGRWQRDGMARGAVFHLAPPG
jgi:hypothetical protein